MNTKFSHPISAQTAKSLLHYESETGRFWWKPRTPDMFCGSRKEQLAICSSWNKLWAKHEVFHNLNVHGYAFSQIFRKHYLGHRIAWLISHGEWPTGHIDHVNGVRSDNRLKNLRCVEPCENNMNMGISKSNTSGRVGVSWFKATKKWHAYIRVKGERIHLGFYENFSDAAEARVNAEQRYGFFDNNRRELKC